MGGRSWLTVQPTPMVTRCLAMPSHIAPVSAIANTVDDTLYQSERYWNASGGGYRFDVPNGQYQVDLKFAEIYQTAAGRRVFDVVIEGVTVVSNLDIFARVGKNVALDLSYATTVSDGRLDVTFTMKTDTPKVNAIHVMPLGPQNTATPTATPTMTPTRTTTPTRTATPFIVRVNSGGGDYTDRQGNLWSADFGFVGGFAPAPLTNAIANTLDDPLFQTDHRWEWTVNPGYVFSVPNGRYEVTLRFAESNQCVANGRKFSVSIEGTTVLPNFDIFVAAGNQCNFAVDRVVTTTVSDGVLTISFTASAAKPKINAIQIKQIN